LEFFFPAWTSAPPALDPSALKSLWLNRRTSRDALDQSGVWRFRELLPHIPNPEEHVITLREGLEAFLIVAISLSYLRKSGRARLTAAVHWGIVVALGVSALGGYVLYHAANQEWLDGPLALVAAASVTWMIVHMWRVGRRMKGDIEGRLQSSSVRPGTAAFTGVFLFTLLMVSREGIETALLLMQLRETEDHKEAARAFAEKRPPKFTGR